MKRVAIIGAGSAGLAAAKACKEDDIDYVCFERSGRIAGLWSYRDEDIDGMACVMKTTVINSSKEMSAFSDFPPPKEFPNYMHNRMMCRYFHMYAERFGLLDNIRYYQEVSQCSLWSKDIKGKCRITRCIIGDLTLSAPHDRLYSKFRTVSKILLFGAKRILWIANVGQYQRFQKIKTIFCGKKQ